MVFNSLSFLLFFPIVTALYFLLPHRLRWALLLAASCFFYMWFVPSYILILGFTIVVDYFAGIWIENQRKKSAGGRARLFLVISIVANVGVLAFFKYFNFLNDNVAELARWIGWNYPIEALRIILPIGLSFHTFQAMSYTIEVYRGHHAAERHFGIYALYVMFYPQLVAGPIERPQNLLHQFHRVHHFNEADAVAGLRLMLWGMFQKVVIADRAALIVNAVYENPAEYHGLAIFIAMCLFSFQIYCDFAGYSNIAIGAARVMGFKLMTNFNHPYMSQSMGEFWRRWHISLSTWFKDYVYLPLGGNRVPLWRQVLNLMIVFVISGLWHGANWTFVIWGALHGMLVSASLLWTRITEHLRGSPQKRTPPPWLRAARRAWVFLLVTIGWVFFRAPSWTDATHLLARVGSDFADVAHRLVTATKLPSGMAHGLVRLGPLVIFILALLAVEALHEQLGPKFEFTRVPRMARWAVYELLLLLILFMGANGGPQFIYFQEKVRPAERSSN